MQRPDYGCVGVGEMKQEEKNVKASKEGIASRGGSVGVEVSNGDSNLELELELEKERDVDVAIAARVPTWRCDSLRSSGSNRIREW